MGERINEVEVEKPFRCSVCSTRFTNEDHLQVHKRRHEMSLSFTKNPSSVGQEGFLDETPTPSRFIRNCEEVGLFQDLNPFDEQFSKAASSTPTSENNFGFQFSQKATNPDDTLNTPQVFGYNISSATPNPNISSSSNIISRTNFQVENETSGKTTTSQNQTLSETLDKEDVTVIKTIEPPLEKSIVFESIPYVITNSENVTASPSKKQKSELRLNIELSPQIKTPSSSGEIVKESFQSRHADNPEKKTELLERNRAAASRSRERRKQWISSLEGKCEGFQADLARAHSEIAKLSAENKILKFELAKHVNCNVTLTQSPMRTKPTILRQVSQTYPTITLPNSPISVPSSPVISSLSAPSPQVPSPIKLPTKRGRPRKGCEKRVSIVQDIPVSKNTEVLKVQIMPLISFEKSNSAQKVFILQS